jgi:cytochrome c
MKRVLVIGAAGIAALCLQTASYAAVDAKAAQAAAKEQGCLNCHEVDKKKVGPAYKEVSAKFKGKSLQDLTAAMKASAVHKSALGKTSDEQLKTILEWVQSL